MAQGQRILIIGRHADLLVRVVDLLNQQGYHAIGKMTNDEAIAIFASQPFDAVIIGGGVDDNSRALFRKEFLRLNPSIKIIIAHPQTVLADLKEAFDDEHN